MTVEDRDKILELHERFKNDLLLRKVNLDGAELIVKPYPYNRSHKDGLPEWFDGLLEKFCVDQSNQAYYMRKLRDKA